MDMPSIAITVGTDSLTGSMGFFLSGSGFSADSTASVFFSYEYSGGITTNDGSPVTVNTDGDGNINGSIIDISTLVDDGDLAVKAVDDTDPGFFAVAGSHWDGGAWVPDDLG
jgi:hypothetical protein